LKCDRFVAQASGGFLEIAKRNKGSTDAAKMARECNIFAALEAALKDDNRPGERETLNLSPEGFWIERILT
jgi:hypothetical protein